MFAMFIWIAFFTGDTCLGDTVEVPEVPARADPVDAVASACVYDATTSSAEFSVERCNSLILIQAAT